MQTNKLIFHILLTVSLKFLVFELTFSASENQSFNRIKSLDCKSMDNKTVTFNFCYAKAYSRKLVTVNVKFTLHKVMRKPFYVEYILSHRTNLNVFQNMFKSNLIEYCDLMDGMDTNPMIKNVILVLNETAPTLFHKCPYEGVTTLTNVTIESANGLIFIPSGTFCSELNFFDRKRKPLAAVKMIHENKNSMDIMGVILRRQ